MIDHIGFSVSDYARAKAFCERAWRRSVMRWSWK
jgi:catechol 2,3-dioxygenase-like lactoylglutathione lyase family enzyme